MRVLPLIAIGINLAACTPKHPELFPAAPCAQTAATTEGWGRVEFTAAGTSIALPPQYVRDDSLSPRSWVATERGAISVFEEEREFTITDSQFRVARCVTQVAGRDVRIYTLAGYGHWGVRFTMFATWEETPGAWALIHAFARDSLAQADQVAAVHTLRR